jgi:hypothetical protein
MHIACPHQILELHDFDPIMIDPASPLDDCIHGEKDCSLWAMACPRLDLSIHAIEYALHGETKSNLKPPTSAGFWCVPPTPRT